MKKVESLAIILIIIVLIAWIIQIGSEIILQNIRSGSDISTVSLYSTIKFVSKNLMHILVQISVAVWLFIVTKKENASQWIWALLGLVFGLMALILFYCIKIYEQHKIKESSEQSTPPDAA